MVMTNAEKQAAWRARQKEKHGRVGTLITCTPDEAFYLQRTLADMRKYDAIPALLRTKRGTYVRVDI